ncbi:phage major capsid protein [Bifidobacterium cuniculi]|uniref:Serine/arginine repetitive matrix protein 2 n=1 Tax=Bifidobacterium cuniculi TaxID=1688 RepID=A0A087B4E9_9BIFI|nr:phage major capsid protein [Bifidobacterium cuniculi]KFI65899.1 serine/arginine repetitive matrix protein 2 [Bifidobacterium cuniculi]
MNLKQQLAAAVKAAQQIMATAQAENRDLTDEEAKSFNGYVAQAEELKAAIARLEEGSNKLKSLVIDDEQVETTEEEKVEVKRLSDRFIHGAAYKGYQELVKKDLAPQDIRLGKTRLGSLEDFYAAKAGTALTSELVHEQPQRLPMIDLVDRPDITLLDVISRGRITAESIEYLQITSVTRNTAQVPENTGDDDTDVQKPQSTFGTELATATVYDYADGYTVTNKMLRDSAVLATFLDTEFRYSFDLKLADILLNGTGTNGQPKGLLNTTGVQAGEYTKGGDEAMNLVKAIRQSLTKLKHVGASANAILLNPADAEKIDLMQDSNQRFFGNGPFALGPSTVWGRPLVESEQVGEGKVIVGDFKQLALLDRTGLSIDVFNQHKDYASRNLVYVRAELAAAQVIWRPSNFVVLEGKAGA